MRKVRIALIQQAATDDREGNRRQGLERARMAASKGANIICFAELAFEPFYPQFPASEERLSMAERIPGKTTEEFSNLAREMQVVIILNLFERDGKRTFDSSPVIDADGSLLGITRMTHIADLPCFYEKGYYYPGDHGAPVYETKFGKVGVAICYDRHFPEYMRALALNGAEIVFTPQAGAVNEWHEGLFEAEMRVAAFQNGYFTALCNRVGKEERLTFSGESFVCDPNGQVIARAESGKEDILICDIDFSLIKTSAAQRYFFRDRRPRLYPKWFSK